MKEVVVPACSSEMQERSRIAQPSDLLALPLIHLVSRPGTWERWFQSHGVDFHESQGMLVDQFAVAMQAATAGLGVALLPAFLIEGELTRGDLVVAWDERIESEESYFLAWPAARENYPPLQAFRVWLREEAATGAT